MSLAGKAITALLMSNQGHHSDIPEPVYPAQSETLIMLHKRGEVIQEKDSDCD
jgi:hypothetical protein